MVCDIQADSVCIVFVDEGPYTALIFRLFEMTIILQG
jgi:hypothetical protein